MKFAVKFVGREVYPGVVEILACFELGKDYLLAQTSYPEGTVLKRVVTTPEDQLSAYDRLKAKLNNPKAIIINSCLMRAYWSDFQFDKSKEKLKLFPCPVIEIYLWGELGVPVPYKNPNHNILAGGTMKALILK